MAFDWAITLYEQLKVIDLDNVPEFVSKALDPWVFRRGIDLCCSRLGKPLGIVWY
jgi:hypothetical protein